MLWLSSSLVRGGPSPVGLVGSCVRCLKGLLCRKRAKAIGTDWRQRRDARKSARHANDANIRHENAHADIRHDGESPATSHRTAQRTRYCGGAGAGGLRREGVGTIGVYRRGGRCNSGFVEPCRPDQPGGAGSLIRRCVEDCQEPLLVGRRRFHGRSGQLEWVANQLHELCATHQGWEHRCRSVGQLPSGLRLRT